MCLITPLTVALIQGDLKNMFSYRDHDEAELTSAPASLNTSNASEGSENGKKNASTKQIVAPKQVKEVKKTK